MELRKLAEERGQMMIDDGGYVTVSIVKFDPDSKSEKTTLPCIGEAWYAE